MKRNAWKKLLMTAVCCCLLFGLNSCSEPVSMMPGEKMVVENHVEITPQNVMVSSQVFPPVSKPDPMGWTLNDDAKVYVTVITKIKNLRDAELTMNDLWLGFRLYVKMDYVNASIVAVATEKGTVLDDGASIAPGKTETVYFITEMDRLNQQEKMSAEFGFDKKTDGVLSVDASRPIGSSQPLVIGKSIQVKGLGTVTPKSVKLMDLLEPSNPGYTFDYYAPKSKEDQMLVVTVDIENQSKKKQAAYRYFNIIAFKDGKEYLADIVSDDAYAANITDSGKVASSENRRAYGTISLPKSFRLEDLDIFLYVDGTYYQYE